jgi:hypothetical protein
MRIRITGWAATTVVSTIAVAMAGLTAVDTDIEVFTEEVEHAPSFVVAVVRADGGSHLVGHHARRYWTGD